MRAFLAIAIVCLLAGCATFNRRVPVPAQIAPECFVPVKDDVRWTGDPQDPATWDILGGQVVPALRSKIELADAHRLACEQGLRRLDKAKIIDLGR